MMENYLVALKLFLDELEIPTAIDTIDDRKKVQKAVYLGQLTGVDLGYRFGWYLKGPYSPSLARDYYNLEESLLEESLAADPTEFEEKKLKKSVKDRLKKVLPIMKPPENVNLNQEDWLELIASWHHLLVVQKATREDSMYIMQREKNHLVDYIETSENKLKEVDLIDIDE